MLREILFYPDQRLREVSAPVGEIDDHVKQVVEDLLHTMVAHGSYGLAAIQIGEPLRIVATDWDTKELPGGVLINPEITWASATTWDHAEGCESFPGVLVTVNRPRLVAFRCRRLDGSEFAANFDQIVSRYAFDAQPEAEKKLAMWSRVLMHEVDHVNGRLLIDHAKARKKEMIERRMGIRLGYGARKK